MSGNAYEDALAVIVATIKNSVENNAPVILSVETARVAAAALQSMAKRPPDPEMFEVTVTTSAYASVPWNELKKYAESKMTNEMVKGLLGSGALHFEHVKSHNGIYPHSHSATLSVVVPEKEKKE